MKPFHLLAIIIFLLGCKKDKNPNYSQYEAVDKSQKTALITEKFVDNHNHWNNIDTGLIYDPNTHPYSVCQLVPAGQMTITGNKGGGQQQFLYDSLPFLQNFELECEIKFITLKPNQENYSRGICYLDWGFQRIGEHVNMIKFEDNGLVDFGDSHGPTRTGIKVQGLKIYDFNKYTIRKVGQDMYFFVNEMFIGKSKLLMIAGNNIGFHVWPYCVFSMRNFRFEKF